MTEIEHCYPLGKSDCRVLMFNIQFDRLLDTSTSSKTFIDFSMADFDGQREHFSNYNDWTLLINMDID